MKKTQSAPSQVLTVKKHALIRLLFLVVLIFLAACSPGAPAQNAAELPTVAALPTLSTPTATVASPTTAATDTTPETSAASTETPTAAATASAIITVTPSMTITDTPTPTWTATPPPTDTEIPTADNEGIVALALAAAQATVMPPAPTSQPGAVPTAPNGVIQIPTLAGSNCPFPPPGGFATVFANNPALVQQIGCPAGAPPAAVSMTSAVQGYQQGQMIWMQGPPPVIYVLFSTGRFQRYDDTYNSSTDPYSGGETPPQGFKEPVRGFGKVWRSNPDVRNGLGWAVDDETGGQATIQIFDRGQMIYLPQRSMIYILIYDAGGLSGTWQAIPGSF